MKNEDTKIYLWNNYDKLYRLITGGKKNRIYSIIQIYGRFLSNIKLLPKHEWF